MSQALPYIQAATALYGATQSGRRGGSQETQQVTADPITAARNQLLFQNALGIAQQPFIPYTGPQIAGFTPDQLRAFDATRGLFAQTQNLNPIAQRQQLINAQTPSLLDFNINAYRSPFEQGVVDVAIEDINRQQEIARQNAQDRAIRAGAFGGSRSAILESEATRPFVQQLGRTVANLRQAGFENAQRQATNDLERLRQQQEFRNELIGDQQRTQQQAINNLLTIGQQQQGLQQQALGTARAEFNRGLAFPGQQLTLLGNALGNIGGGTRQVNQGLLSGVDRTGQILGSLELLGQYLPQTGDGNNIPDQGGQTGGKGGSPGGKG